MPISEGKVASHVVAIGASPSSSLSEGSSSGEFSGELAGDTVGLAAPLASVFSHPTPSNSVIINQVIVCLVSIL